tara:strand:+ start:37 stop:315 length:279 start_codon:yes stop_codon:yes gene_type:complete
MSYEREVYGFMDLVSDIAGLYELIVGICGLFLYSVAKNRFVLSAISHYFLIKTVDPDLIDYQMTSHNTHEDEKVSLKTKSWRLTRKDSSIER